MNPNAAGFRPKAFATDTPSSHTYEWKERPGSRASSTSFASQPGRAFSTSPDPLSPTLSNMRLGDPFIGSTSRYGQEKTDNVVGNTPSEYVASNFDHLSGANISFSFARQRRDIADGSPHETSNGAPKFHFASKSWSGPSAGRHDSAYAPASLHTDAEAIAQYVMTGATAPPGDRGLNDGAIEHSQPDQESSNPHVGRYKNSKMFGPHSVHAAVWNAAQNRPSRSSFSRKIAEPSPPWFQEVITKGSLPSVEAVLGSMPLDNPAAQPSTTSDTSVLRVSDIPYATTRQEMVAFVGKQARISRMPAGSSPFYAIHIIMERESSKTMECFIEFSKSNEAALVLKTLNNRKDAGRAPKVSNRLVSVSLSSQEELMYELFPRAKHVAWKGTDPVVDMTKRQYYAGQDAAGFDGFIHREELGSMKKIAEMAENSIFAGRMTSRIYDAMISLLNKYPWYATEYVSLRERRDIFDLTEHMIKCLINAMTHDTRSRTNPHNVTSSQPKPPPLPTTLLEELVVAALSCTGFNENQKAIIVDHVANAGFHQMTRSRPGLDLGGSSSFSALWPFKAHNIAPGIDEKYLRFFVSLLRDATLTREEVQLLIGQSQVSASQYKPFGNFKINYGTNSDITIAEATKLELEQVSHTLHSLFRGHLA